MKKDDKMVDMTLSTQPYKGARDFYPEEMFLQNYIFGVWRQVCERAGYEEYLTPMIEPTEVYLAKSSEEIVRDQTYTFEDRGGRQVTIRPEMTPSVSRMVAAKRQELGYPLRLFSICNYMRYERPQRGRLREFWQLNADIFGIDGISAEHEVVTMADQLFQTFGAKRSMYEIRLNSRKFVNYFLTNYVGLTETETTTMVRLIDRIDKLPRAEFITMAEMVISPALRGAGAVTRILSVLDAKDLTDIPADLASHETLIGLNELMITLKKDGITNARFDIKLMRGFDYYTDIVFEAFDLHPDNNRAMFGGGRYDGLVGQFGVAPVATFGFAPGDASAALFLQSHGLAPKYRSISDLYVVLAGVNYNDVSGLLAKFRSEGVNVAVDMSPGKKIGDQIKNAEKKSIRYVSVMGEKELQSERYNIKDLHTGKIEEHGFERMVTILLANR